MYKHINPLCILNNADFNVVYIPVEDKPVDILNYGQCGDIFLNISKILS